MRALDATRAWWARRKAGALRVWGGPQGTAALVVIAVMVVWRSVLLAGSYFNQDDYFFLHRALSSDLTFDYLFRTPNAGHVNPAQQLTFWIAARTSPFDWPVYAASQVIAQALTTFLMWHVLTRLLPGRWVRVALLAAFAWSPLTLMTTLWWCAALCLWPHLFCSLWGVLCLIRARQGVGRRWLNLTGAFVAQVAGLMWHERAILITPVLLATAVLLADDVRGWRRVPVALWRLKWLWVAIVIFLGGFLAWHAHVTSVEGGESDPGTMLHIAWTFLGQNVVPGVVSGPWSATLQGGAVEPHTWVTVVSLVIVAVAVAALLRFGGPVRWWALAFFVAYALSDLALVLAGRGGFGSVIGLDPRYASDTLHAAVLAVAFALRDAPERYGTGVAARSWPRARTLVLGAGVGAYAVGASFGSAVLVPHFQYPEDRAYISNLRTDLARDPNQVLVDALVPPDIVLPLVGDDSLLSRVLSPLPEDPVFDQPSPVMRQVTTDGHLVPVVLAGGIPMQPGPVPQCGWSADASGVTVPLLVEIRGRLVAHLGYYTGTESTVQVSAGGWSSRFLARPGPNELWFVIPDAGRAVTEVGFRVEGPGTVCVSSLQVGLPEPR